jgi:hypothetical protein
VAAALVEQAVGLLGEDSEADDHEHRSAQLSSTVGRGAGLWWLIGGPNECFVP